MNKKRALLSTLCLLLVAGLTLTIPVNADKPGGGTSGAHFFTTDASVTTTGQLCVAFDEAGVGNSEVHITITCAGQFVWGCINGGDNHPQATNKETTNAQASGGSDFEPKNGRVTGTVCTVAPTPPSDLCPSGQTLVLASATFTGCTLSDTTSSVSLSQSDISGSFSRTFVTFKK